MATGAQPTHAGHWWYRVGDGWSNAGQVWCVRVQSEKLGDPEPTLCGWRPGMGYTDPIDDGSWDGEWLGEAIAPAQDVKPAGE